MSLLRGLKRTQRGTAAITVYPATIAENTVAATLIGYLNVPTNFGVYTYAVTDDASGAVALSGANAIVTGATNIDFETTPTISFNVTATPAGGGAVLTQTLTITVTDVTYTFSALTLATPTVDHTATTGTVVGALSGRTSGSTLALFVTDGNRFALSGTNITVGATAITGGSGPRSITVRETKADYTTRDTVFAIAVT